MPAAVRVEVEAILNSFTERLRAVLDQAMRDWEGTPNKSWFIYPRVRANIIFSFIARRALEEFSDDDDVHIINESQTVKFLFRDAVLVRFKKGNSRGVGSNIVTQAVLDFVDPQLAFAGLPDVHRVEIVYQFDLLGTGYSEVAVVARDRSARIWSYLLSGKPSAEVIPLPPRVTPVLTPPVVTPKAPPAEKSSEDDPSE
jgi:hypothetical protein